MMMNGKSESMIIMQHATVSAGGENLCDRCAAPRNSKGTGVVVCVPGYS